MHWIQSIRNNGQLRHKVARHYALKCGLVLCCLTLTPGRTFNKIANAAPGQPRVAATFTDLRPVFNRYRLTIKLQGARDTCHVFTVVAALEYAVARKYEYGVGLSEEYLNWAANQTTKQMLDGASFVELAQGLKKWGVCEENLMPYLPVFRPDYRPSPAAFDSARDIHNLKFRWHWIKMPATSGNTHNDKAYDGQLQDVHITAIKDVLRKGWPVCAGRDHNVLIVGFRDDSRQAGGGSFTIRNSNSRSYRNMSYADMKSHCNAALWIDLPLDEQ